MLTTNPERSAARYASTQTTLHVPCANLVNGTSAAVKVTGGPATVVRPLSDFDKIHDKSDFFSRPLKYSISGRSIVR